MPRKPAIQVDVARLRELFELRPDGTLVYAQARGKVRAGSKAGYARADGYHVVCVDWTKLLAHRVVFALHHGYWPTRDIDHIDGDVSNNAPSNLRECLHVENQRNRSNGNKRNTSGFAGVIWDKARKLWAVQVHCCGKNYHFGRHESIEVAELVAYEARRRLFGAFAPVTP